jgi:hypothetical protein
MSTPYSRKKLTAIIGGCLAVVALGSSPLQAANPCAAKPMNPCAAKPMNPCAAKPMNPCAAKPMNPCAAKPMNPCAANNKAAGVTRPADYKPYQGDHAALVSEGAKLFKDTSLSTNGMSCNSCHNNNGMFQTTFAQPYPHYVQMANDQFKIKAVHADEMVQLCMVAPMAAQPLPWDSRELAALTAYVTEQQKVFAKQHKTGAMNPCAAKPMNPCAAKPMNPCAAKPMNPCAAKPMNPCAAKPMNPCSAK